MNSLKKLSLFVFRLFKIVWFVIGCNKTNMLLFAVALSSRITF